MVPSTRRSRVASFSSLWPMSRVLETCIFRVGEPGHPAEGSTRRRLVDGGTHKEAATRDNPATAPRGRHLRGRPVGRERRGVSSAGELAGGARDEGGPPRGRAYTRW